MVVVAAAVLSFAALHDLALACGIGGAVLGVPLTALLPVAIDAAGVVATRLWLTLPSAHPARSTARAVVLCALAGSVAGNGAQHGMAAYGVVPPWWAVVAVSAVPPVALAAVAHLAALVGRRVPDAVDPDDEHTDGAGGLLDVTDDHGLSRMWETAPPAPGDRAAELIAAGAGRRRLSRELAISEHEARALLARSRDGGGDRG